jgi:hypothetical protein
MGFFIHVAEYWHCKILWIVLPIPKSGTSQYYVCEVEACPNNIEEFTPYSGKTPHRKRKENCRPNMNSLYNLLGIKNSKLEALKSF